MTVIAAIDIRQKQGMGGTKIQLLLACEYQIISLGISRYLEEKTNLTINHHLSTLNEVYSSLKSSEVDIAIIELALLKSSGLSAIQELLKLASNLKIIVLSRNEREPFISKCIEMGALGYVSLKCEPQELFDAIDTVRCNDKYLSKDVAYDFALSNLDKDKQLFSILTTREYEVFTQLSKGLSVADIAKAIHLSTKTIHVYRANIMEKLKIKSLSELTLIALKHGIISIDLFE